MLVNCSGVTDLSINQFINNIFEWKHFRNALVLVVKTRRLPDDLTASLNLGSWVLLGTKTLIWTQVSISVRCAFRFHIYFGPCESHR